VFAYQTKQQAGFSLKYLVLLPAIGTAYVWRNGTGVELPSCTLNSGCAWRCAKLCVSVPLAGFSPIKKERSPHLWRGDRSNLVADQLPAGRHFCEHEAAMELAGGGFPAVLLLNRGPIRRDRYIAVNPNFHVRIHFNGI